MIEYLKTIWNKKARQNGNDFVTLSEQETPEDKLLERIQRDKFTNEMNKIGICFFSSMACIIIIIIIIVFCL